MIDEGMARKKWGTGSHTWVIGVQVPRTSRIGHNFLIKGG